MANEYFLGDDGILLWAPEATPYTAETTIDNYFGIISEDVEMPNPNDQTMLSSVGHYRRPFVATSEPREYPFSIPVQVIDARLPLECIIGQRKKYDLTIGFQTISNSEAEFTGSESIADGTYHINVNDDGNGINDVSVVCSTDTITSMLVKLQAAIRVATGGSETAAIEYGLIKIASGTTGASSSIALTEGAGDDGGLIAALSAISGVTASIDTAQNGVASASWEYEFDDENQLSTVTVYWGHRELGMTQVYAGCKASMNLTCNVGEPLKATLNFLGTHMVQTTSVSAFQQPSTALPSTEPYRFWMVSDAQLNTAGGGQWKDMTAITGIDFTWDNGLEVIQTRGHVRSSAWSKEGYVCAEVNNSDRYDMKIDCVIDSTDLFVEAYNDDTLYDFYIKFERVYNNDTNTFEIWLYSCKISGLPVNLPAQGKIEAQLTLHPLDTKIRIVTSTEITV